jgi:hypothetical protein
MAPELIDVRHGSADGGMAATGHPRPADAKFQGTPGVGEPDRLPAHNNPRPNLGITLYREIDPAPSGWKSTDLAE